MKRIVYPITVALASYLSAPERAEADFPGFTHKSNGEFKQLDDSADPWYQVESSVRAPDKWVHGMGSYVLREAAQAVSGSSEVGIFGALAGGVGKEYLDGFRDGWSKKDLFADLIGIAISELNRRSDSFKLFFDYKTPESGDGNIMLKLYYTF